MRLWVTGYRSYELGIFSPNDPKIEVIKYCLQDNLKEMLFNENLEWVLSGGQLGVEQWGLETALELSQANLALKTALLYPFLDFGNNWKDDKRIALKMLEEQCDYSISLSNQPYQNAQQLKNYQQFMLEHTEGCLLIYDPEYEGKAKYDYQAILKYQQMNSYFLKQIDMYDLQDYGEQYQENQNWGLQA